MDLTLIAASTWQPALDTLQEQAMSDSSPPIASIGPVLFAVGTIGVAVGVVGITVMVNAHRPSPEPMVQRVAEPPTRSAPAVHQAPAPSSDEPQPEPIKLIVKRVASMSDAIDPFAPMWMDAQAVNIPLEPQMLTTPMLEHATVKEASARAVTDGNRIAWLIAWDADQPATVSDTGQFSDAVGIQFPLIEDASYMMGGPGMPVQAFYWRAQWQKDIDDRFQDVYAMYPNFFSCGYWFAEGDFPPRVPESFSDVRSHQWFVAQQAGNPMADFNRTRPVDEMIAEGFGTLTYKPEGIADGRGEWRDGRWYVVFDRPIADDALSRQFRAGESSQFGVAVWDGGAGNVGSRKHYSFWVPFEVER
jgi:hypothetical protein